MARLSLDACVAFYLVGVRTSAKTPKGSLASFCRMGRAKAAVLPLPVCAVPSTSLPARMAGMHPCWTSVGFTMPRERHTLQIQRPEDVSILQATCMLALHSQLCWRAVLLCPLTVIAFRRHSKASQSSESAALCRYQTAGMYYPRQKMRCSM